jgi:hypothetical protein
LLVEADAGPAVALAQVFCHRNNNRQRRWVICWLIIESDVGPARIKAAIFAGEHSWEGIWRGGVHGLLLNPQRERRYRFLDPSWTNRSTPSQTRLCKSL